MEEEHFFDYSKNNLQPTREFYEPTAKDKKKMNLVAM